MRLRLMGGLCAVFLCLLMAFAMCYQVRLEMLERDTGILEMLAAAIPLLSLLLASIFYRSPTRAASATRPAGHHRPGSSARR
ncbi:hypothetical protein [Herbaspirillum sp. RV1423]|uniref:hypothetical protein n=1 Tax=Herbaspirillum sp. RV1423 TaxID=1443993 RepID=UPI0004B5071C|nr:hypothetical protein [Herbaspirillum sp. RV1423]